MTTGDGTSIFEQMGGMITNPSYYTEAQLQAAVREARDQAIEDCAKLAEAKADGMDTYGAGPLQAATLRWVADLLRGLSTPSEAWDPPHSVEEIVARHRADIEASEATDD